MRRHSASLGNSAGILALILLLAAAVDARAKSHAVVMGQTFAIAEPDTIEEIKQAAKARNWRSLMMRPPSQYSAFTSASLPYARRDASRLFDPTYVLPMDIRDDKGKMLYARGTKVNVYERMKLKLKGRYIVIAPLESHYRWLKEVARPTSRDKILLANGNVMDARRKTRRELFVIDQRVVERLGLKAAPAIVQQEGNQLRITEYALAR